MIEISVPSHIRIVCGFRISIYVLLLYKILLLRITYIMSEKFCMGSLQNKTKKWNNKRSDRKTFENNTGVIRIGDKTKKV